MIQSGDVLDDELARKLRLEGIIAHGSFGIVYRAQQLAVDRSVAVKVLHDGFALDTLPGQLFRDEIRAIGTIDHRNVVRIFDADETRDGRLYFVMELLDGLTLQELADRGPMPAARAIGLVGQLLDGLAAVHAAGRIHADVKPSNAVVCGAPGDERVVLIDFGLSRVRPADRPAEAVGGTRAYMAPEQLHNWEVDARSDVFSAALVLVTLITGGVRRSGELAPPLDTIRDPAQRRAIERALALDPAHRPSAHDFARALLGGAPHEAGPPGLPRPFQELAPLTERDRGRIWGREADVLRLARRIELGSVVVLTAPSGTGKTSLLRAGVIPYLDAAGIASEYVTCRELTGSVVSEALARRPADGRPFVVILDQVEVALGVAGDGPAVLAQLLGIAAAPGIAIVLSVREDYVARLLAASPALTEGVPQLRLRPLDLEGARAALLNPFGEHAVELSPALRERLIDDLARAGGELGVDLGWSSEASIYPPHLQLVGAALFDAVDLDHRALDVAHYERLGGLSAIIAGQLDRTLAELSADDRAIARDVLLSLVTPAQPHTVRDVDLAEAVAPRHGEPALRGVLARLEARRLLVRTSGRDGTLSWALIHDSLAPRVEAWLTIEDLDRRRAAEVLRFHLRQSQPETPALLSARQIRQLARFGGLIDEIESEWQRRSGSVWKPHALVQRSRQVLRYRNTLIASLASIVLILTLAVSARWLDERALRRREQQLRELNLGRFDLALELFDLHTDPDLGVKRAAVDPHEFAAFDWALFDPSVDDPDEPGAPITAPRFRHGHASVRRQQWIESAIEARGGAALLVVTGRGRSGETCSPSIIPLRHLPGNDHYADPRAFHIFVPTCRATWFDTVPIARGRFIAHGLGDPPAHFAATDLPAEREVVLPGFRIDRTEVSNAAFAIFAEMVEVHDIEAPDYPDALATARGPSYPRGDIDWFEARAYCRFLGKDLPTSLQWQKALRGGTELPGGPNPAPRRNTPWLPTLDPAWTLAQIPSDKAAPAAGTSFGQAGDMRRPAPIAVHPRDYSPYGVLDLAGNVQEWTLDTEPGREGVALRLRPRITRGGNWFDTRAAALTDYMAIQNPRQPHARRIYLGMRCAVTASGSPDN